MRLFRIISLMLTLRCRMLYRQ